MRRTIDIRSRGFLGLVTGLALSAGTVGCGPTIDASELAEARGAADVIRAAAIEQHIRVLADDRLEGRGPGTRGFKAASFYVEANFTSLGLEPAGTVGYRQPVSLQANRVDEQQSSFSLTRGRAETRFGYGEDFTLAPNPALADLQIDAPVVFVGFGISAPSLGYDDYADIDVRGKIVAHLSGAPTTLPNDERAYYSSPAIKKQIAAENGAVGMISFGNPDDARSSWPTLVDRARRGTHAWLDDDDTPRGRGGASRIGSVVTLNRAATAALFEGSQVSLEEALRTAADGRPQAFPLDVRAEVRTVSTHEKLRSHNLIGRIEGSDPALRDEHLVFVAHLDHLGIGQPVRGDSIYNGAHDNASGTSIMIEMARAFQALDEAPRRSILFLAVTAEEWGLLGSDYFVHNPTVPKEDLVAGISLDMPFMYYPLRDIVPFGADHSSLGDAVEAAAEAMNVAVSPDPWPEEVIFIRSDHFSFVQQGIPALFMKSGFETGDDRDGEKIHDDFRRERYHTPFDEVDQGFDFEAGASLARFHFLTGYYVAQKDARPAWNEDDFFGGLFAQNR